MTASDQGGALAGASLALIALIAVVGLVLWKRQPAAARQRPGPVSVAVQVLGVVFGWAFGCAAMLAVAGVVLLVLVAVLKWAWRTVFH